MISTRRSIRSDIQPIGYCSTSAPTKITETKIEILRNAQPGLRCHRPPPCRTAPQTRRPAGTCRHMPAARRGRARAGSSAWWSSKAGVGLTDSRIGANEIDTSTDGMTNSTKPAGSPKPRIACAGDDAHHLHDHVERQRLAAGLVGGGVVQPAFGGDVDAGEAEPDDHAQQDPDPRVRRSWDTGSAPPK